MKINIVSPHIDDAAYGLSLHISRFISSNLPVNIINCFTVTKWTAVFVPGDVKEVSLLRAQEDMAFNKVFNSVLNITNLDLLDAPLRNGYVLQPGPFVENELSLVEEIRNYLHTNVEGILLCPLGIGNHIDHAICREAALELYKDFDVLFYEDLPYAYRITPEQTELHIQELEERLNVKLMPQVDGLQNCTIDKEQVVRLYKSQMNDEICSEIISHMNVLAGERLWAEEQVMVRLRNALSC